jgi:hypothetical protein
MYELLTTYIERREYLDHCRVYEPALEILDEVQELNPMASGRLLSP